jgi:hypothetical protein
MWDDRCRFDEMFNFTLSFSLFSFLFSLFSILSSCSFGATSPDVYGKQILFVVKDVLSHPFLYQGE